MIWLAPDDMGNAGRLARHIAAQATAEQRFTSPIVNLRGMTRIVQITEPTGESDPAAWTIRQVTGGSPIRARIIRERGAAIKLNALETGKQEQCLKVIHPHLPKNARFRRLILKADLIRSALLVTYKLASKYLIRVFVMDGGVGNEKLPVKPDVFTHDLSPVGVPAATVADGEGTEQPSPDGADELGDAAEVPHA